MDNTDNNKDSNLQIPLLCCDINTNPVGIPLILYSIQHLTFFVANSAIIPVVVGNCLGLDNLGVASLVQRTFIFCGIGSFLQSLWGHRFPIFEGPAGMWVGIFIAMSASAEKSGKPIEVLRTDLEMGLIFAGVFCIIIGVIGLMSWLSNIFSPMVNGVFLILMALQLSETTIKGLLGYTSLEHILNMKYLLVSTVTIGLIVWISLRGKGFWQSIAVLIGTCVGWLISIILGIAPKVEAHGKLSRLPEIFAWGTPTFDPGIIVTCILTALILFSNLIASIVGMSGLTKIHLKEEVYNRGVIFTGVSDLLAGFGSVVGFIPYASAVGFTALTGVASRVPFMLAALLLVFLGIFPFVGKLFSAIPSVVGYSVLFVVFSLILGLGAKELSKVNLNNRSLFILGISIFTGVGMMFIPQELFNQVPVLFKNFLSNGLIDGVLICIILEKFLPD